MASSAAIRYTDNQHDGFAQYVEEARKKLIVALDFSTIAEAREMVRTLGDEVVFYKVGLGLQLEGGDRFAKELKKDNKRVFLDYKYYDIPEPLGTRSLARLR